MNLFLDIEEIEWGAPLLPSISVLTSRWQIPRRKTVTMRGEDEQLGALNRMAIMDTAMPEFTETLDALNAEIVEVGELAETWDERLKHAPSLQARLKAVKKCAALMQPHSDKVLELGNRFAVKLNEIDFGLTTDIQQSAVEFETGDSATKEKVCELFASIGSMVEARRGGLSAIRTMAESVEQVEGTSKDIRPPLVDHTQRSAAGC